MLTSSHTIQPQSAGQEKKWERMRGLLRVLATFFGDLGAVCEEG